MAGKPVLHFLLVPHMEYGHIIPMLSLASQLLALGCRVTFVKGDKLSEAVRSADEKQLEERMTVELQGEEAGRLVFVRVGGWAESTQTFEQELKGLEETRKPLVTRLINDSRASAHPISCIISDFFMWKWMSPLALSFGLPVAFLHPCSATFFYVLVLENKFKYAEMEDLLVSGFGLPTRTFLDSGVSSSRHSPEEQERITDFFRKQFDGFEDAGHIVFANSFKHLEAPLLPFLETSPLDFKFFGPCLPTWSEEDAGMMMRHAGSVFSEQQACMPWLDKQEKGSVLFVSFGSQGGMMAAEQMEELAMGIEKSNHKFLWVVRQGAAVGVPEAFRERIERGGGDQRGMFVSWVPQTKVLQHPAVGGFLTHNGWNSTIESVTFGVPMLSLPFFGDQPLQANLAQWYWKVGVRLGPSKNGNLIERDEVERGVRTIMEGHTSERVAHFQQAAQSAIVDARQTLISFMQAIIESK